MDAALESLSQQLTKIILDEREEILIQDLMDQIHKNYSEEETATSPRESNLIVAAANAAGEKTKCDHAGEHYTAQSLFPTNMLGVKHPYIIVIFAYFHPLLIMLNVGTSLALFIENVEFRSKWKHNIWLRRSFAYDIGQSALNLSTNFHLCHNDIRPPNIAVKSDSFCLIDFDLCSDDLLDSCILSSRLVMLVPESTIDALKMKQMMLTVSQMAFVVFTMETLPESDALSEMNRYWLTDQNLAKPRSQAQLNIWAKSKGPMVEHLFSGEPSALDATQIDRDYFIRLLDAILTLKGAQATHF
jgi:hypothetical protein